MRTDRLQFSLSLKVGTTTHTIAGSAIKHAQLDVRSYGLTGIVEFVLTDDDKHGGAVDDKLLSDFLSSDLIEVTLQVAWIYLPEETTLSSESLSLSGLVQRKSLSEMLYRRTKDLPILARRYRIEFADPAQVLWKQHFPCELYTQTTVKDVITAHAGDAIQVQCDWDTLSQTKDLFFVHLEPRHGVSFYDFVLWYLDAQGGVWYYDYSAQSYTIAAEKPNPTSSIHIFGDDIARAQVRCSEVPRYQSRVLNSYANSASTTAIAQEQAVSGIRQDILLRTAIADDVDTRVTLETSRVTIPLYEVEFEFERGLAASLAPGTGVEFQSSNRWSSESAIIGKTWRVWGFHLDVDACQDEPDVDSQADKTAYEGQFAVQLEQKDDPCVKLPGFRIPHYPGFIEGKIVSEQGDEGQKTYQIYQDDDTSLEYYKVTIPLWSDQQITVPFDPYQGSGNVYIPAYKDARVLVAVDLENAYIRRLLDWRDGAPLSMDVQGEQLYFGKSATSNTTVSHVYDSDQPVFAVARINDSDTSSIRLEEGTLTIQVKEDQEGSG